MSICKGVLHGLYAGNEHERPRSLEFADVKPLRCSGFSPLSGRSGSVPIAGGARTIVLTLRLRTATELPSLPFGVSSLSPAYISSRYLLPTWYRRNATLVAFMGAWVGRAAKRRSGDGHANA
jgi:hypothetical protein